MTIHVTDTASNRQDQIANAARVVGRSPIRRKVFDAIFSGKQHVKTQDDIHEKTGLSYKQILNSAVQFIHEKMVVKVKVNGKIAYQKDSFYTTNKSKILKLAGNPVKLDQFPTKYTPKFIGAKTQVTTIKVLSNSIQACRVTIDEIDSFKEVRKVQNDTPLVPHAEAAFKKGLKKLLREAATFKDWGGETDDLFSTRLKMNGKRMAVAFGLKGKGTKGKLTPKKMGKNGDQIQRLYRSPADVFLVQYWGEVDASVHEQMKTYATVRSIADGKKVYYGVIDGQDSLRLIKAYPKYFKL